MCHQEKKKDERKKVCFFFCLFSLGAREIKVHFWEDRRVSQRRDQRQIAPLGGGDQGHARKKSLGGVVTPKWHPYALQGEHSKGCHVGDQSRDGRWWRGCYLQSSLPLHVDGHGEHLCCEQDLSSSSFNSLGFGELGPFSLERTGSHLKWLALLAMASGGPELDWFDIIRKGDISLVLWG